MAGHHFERVLGWPVAEEGLADSPASLPIFGWPGVCALAGLLEQVAEVVRAVAVKQV